MVGPSGRRYEATAWQCAHNFFRGLAGSNADYGTRHYSTYYDVGWKISCGFYLCLLTSPLWGGGLFVGYLIWGW